MGWAVETQELVFKSNIRLKSPKSPNSRSSRLENLEFGLFGLFSRVSDFNTNSCGRKKRENSSHVALASVSSSAFVVS